MGRLAADPSSVRIPPSPSLQALTSTVLSQEPHILAFVMKFSALVTLVPLLLSSSLAYATTPRDVFQARQAHVVKKGIVDVDVCVALDLDVNIDLVGV